MSTIYCISMRTTRARTIQIIRGQFFYRHDGFSACYWKFAWKSDVMDFTGIYYYRKARIVYFIITRAEESIFNELYTGKRTNETGAMKMPEEKLI